MIRALVSTCHRAFCRVRHQTGAPTLAGQSTSQGRPTGWVYRLGTLAILLTLAACSESTPTGVDDSPIPLPELSITPAAAQPGQIVELGGSFVDALADSLASSGTEVAAAGITLEIGGLPAAVRLLEDGRIRGAVPILAAGTDGQSPPSEAQDVVLLREGTPVAGAQDAFTVQAMPSAPGESEAFVTRVEALQSELLRISELLHEQGSADYGYATVVLEGLGQLLSGPDEESLASMIAATPDTELAFVDAYIASTGVVDRMEALVDLYGGLKEQTEVFLERDPAETASAVGPRVGAVDPPTAFSYTPPSGAEVLPDLTLARKMQFQVILELFAETVVNETASEWGLAGLGIGGVGLVLGNIPDRLSRGIPVASQVSAVLGVADFVANKILVGLNPSEVTTLALDAREPRVGYDERTAVEVWIEARNTPPPVGIQDMVGATLSVLGLAAGQGPAAQSMEDVLSSVAEYFIGAIQSGLAAYSSAHPEANMDVTFEAIPQWTWAARILDRRLVDLLSFTPEIITPREDEVSFQSGESPGEGRIAARIATGPDTHLLDPPPGFSYDGGAFGESVLQSETRSVFVDGELALAVVSAPERLEGDEVGTLIVEAGVDSPDGLVPRPGIDIEILVDGGQVENATGVTDANGLFTTSVQLLPDSDGMILSITATNDFDESLTESVEIGAEGTAAVEWLTNETAVEVFARVFLVGADGPSTDNVGDTTQFNDFSSGTVTATAELTRSSGPQTLAASAASSLDWAFESSGTTRTFRGQHESRTSASAALGHYYEDEADGNADAHLEATFRVSEPTPYRIVAQVSGGGGDDLEIELESLSGSAGTRVDLIDASLTVDGVSSMDQTGILGPGIYRFKADGGSDAEIEEEGASGTVSDSQTYSARIELGGS